MNMNLPVDTHKMEVKRTVVQIWHLWELQLIQKVKNVWWWVVAGEAGEVGLDKSQSIYKLY